MSATITPKVSEQVDSGVTRWSKRLGLVLFGWMLANVYHGTQNLEVQAAKVAVTQTEAKCEHRRADKATNVAGQAILSANVDEVAPPKFKDLPVDNCQHDAAK